MPIFRVRHVTTYRYRRPVRFGRHRLMFRPRDSHDQRLLSADLAVTPAPSALRWILDVFGNCVALVDIETPADELRFETRILLDHTPQDFPIPLPIPRKKRPTSRRPSARTTRTPRWSAGRGASCTPAAAPRRDTC